MTEDKRDPEDRLLELLARVIREGTEAERANLQVVEGAA